MNAGHAPNVGRQITGGDMHDLGGVSGDANNSGTAFVDQWEGTGGRFNQIDRGVRNGR